MFSRIALLPAFLPVALACLGYEGGVPTPTAHYSNSAVIEIAAGEVFDAGWAKYDRGSGACGGQTEGDWKDAVFYLHSGATLKNVIIGADQSEGVHCDGACTLEFVWFEDVCEDAISIGTTARDGGEVVGINQSFGDTATLVNVCTDADHPCVLYDGCEGDCEPSKVGYCSG
ncbi:unnamed protein product [Aspergillus oryzae var. brunneus]|uniref:Pectate lyase n=1 Tax=Aspergillus oryzae var. brunneus TaxID=332754 RepID=A0ABQ6KZA0_ASPOZ|nr:unnamed protein product [Aspergillus oryzae var. brunneus]